MTSPQPKSSLPVVFSIICIDLLGFGLVLPLLPLYGRDLLSGASKTEIRVFLVLLMTSFSVMQTIFSPIWGRLSDRFGRRPVLLMSLAGSMLCYLLFGLATWFRSVTWILISRIGAGIAAATIPTAQAYIADVTPPERRTHGMALIGAAFGLGFTLGPLLGAASLFLTADSSGVSPWTGYGAGILSGLALLVAFLRLPESVRPDALPETRRHLDLAALRDIASVPSLGMLFLTGFLSVLSLAGFESTLSLSIDSRLTAEQPSAPGPVASAGGAESTGPELKGIDERLVRTRMMLVFAFIGVVQCLVQGGLVRRLAKTWSEWRLAMVGGTMSVAGFLMMAFQAQAGFGGVPWLMFAAAVEVAGIGFLLPAIQSLVSRRADPAKQGGVLGAGESLSSIARIAGFGVGVPLFMEHPALPFWSAALLMAAATLLFAFASRLGKDWEERPEQESLACCVGTGPS